MDNLWSVLAQTLALSVAAAVLLAAKRLFLDKLSPRWQYGVWAILALRALLPAGLLGRTLVPGGRVVLEAARLQVELPLAMPTIIGGLRLSTVYTVSWAVLAAMIGQHGLGDFVYRGVSSNNNELILQGAIPAALLALLLGGLVDLLQRHVVPRGLRKGGGDR